ncbi:Smr/MutS family protein [Bartonella sp. HY038]|uniref:Smr/MutS family protein n=1 Tax=Bartonella sp. HY038 TaxID=2759660 RepID=UPI0015FD2841|nr:Smr/MutS family protein [Bartonella sp. HY038]
MQSDFGKKQQKNTSGKSRFNVLRPEDKALWDAVAKSIRPLRMSTAIAQADSDPAEFKTMLASGDIAPLDKNKAKRAQADNYSPKSSRRNNDGGLINPIDRKTHRKIAKGRLDIDGRIDLHGLTQSEAHTLLLRFLQSAQFRGFRHVLIITGKGKSLQSDGILRQLVPHWLSTPAFRIYISAINDAARHHGGDGAIYLKLRKLSA